MKRTLLAMLLVLICMSMPLRLLGLAVDMFVVSPGHLRETGSDTEYWSAQDLESRLSGLGWQVHYESELMMNGSALYGLTDPSMHVISVDSTLHWSNRFVVLAHEAGHTLQPQWVTREQGECFAEGVATIVSHDGLSEHARYLAPLRWSCLGMFAAEWPAIYHAAAVLEDR